MPSGIRILKSKRKYKSQLRQQYVLLGFITGNKDILRNTVAWMLIYTRPEKPFSNQDDTSIQNFFTPLWATWKIPCLLVISPCLHAGPTTVSLPETLLESSDCLHFGLKRHPRLFVCLFTSHSADEGAAKPPNWTPPWAERKVDSVSNCQGLGAGESEMAEKQDLL